MNRLNRFLAALLLIALASSAFAIHYKPVKRDYYQIKVYRLKTNEQIERTDAFLKDAYLPALHRLGIPKVGVFKFIGNDTAAEKTMYVFIPLRSAEQLNDIDEKLAKDEVYHKDGDAFLNAPFNAPAYTRIESILLYAFSRMPQFQAPVLQGNPAERIYELRSYESATEQLNKKKVQMFNEGGEVTLFKRLGFNAVFYAEVLAGSHMPNLMYMTSFDNRAARDEHWKTFGADPEWKNLSAMPEYKNTVSKSDVILLHPAAYSEL